MTVCKIVVLIALMISLFANITLDVKLFLSVIRKYKEE